MYRQRIEMDMEEFWRYLMKNSRREGKRMTQKTNNITQVAKNTYERKNVEHQERNVWDPRKIQEGVVK